MTDLESRQVVPMLLVLVVMQYCFPVVHGLNVVVDGSFAEFKLQAGTKRTVVALISRSGRHEHLPHSCWQRVSMQPKLSEYLNKAAQ